MCIDCGELISVLYGLCHKCLKKSHEASRVAEMSLPGGLRDQFAMAALSGLINNTPADVFAENPYGIAENAALLGYVIADAMLEARKQR